MFKSQRNSKRTIGQLVYAEDEKRNNGKNGLVLNKIVLVYFYRRDSRMHNRQLYDDPVGRLVLARRLGYNLPLGTCRAYDIIEEKRVSQNRFAGCHDCGAALFCGKTIFKIMAYFLRLSRNRSLRNRSFVYD